MIKPDKATNKNYPAGGKEGSYYCPVKPVAENCPGEITGSEKHLKQLGKRQEGQELGRHLEDLHLAGSYPQARVPQPALLRTAKESVVNYAKGGTPYKM